MAHHLLALFGMPGGAEWLVILIVGLLLFGRRLPEIARSMGKSIVEFKRGMQDVKNDIERAADDRPALPRDTKPPTQLGASVTPRSDDH